MFFKSLYSMSYVIDLGLKGIRVQLVGRTNLPFSQLITFQLDLLCPHFLRFPKTDYCYRLPIRNPTPWSSSMKLLEIPKSFPRDPH